MPSSATGALGAKAAGVRRWFAPLLAIPTPVIFIAAAIIATAVMWRGGALNEVASSLRRVSPVVVLVILQVYAGSISILGARWHVLARMAGGDPPWGASAEVFLTSVIVNYAAPIGLAVPTRAALSVRDLGLSAGQSAGVVTWEALLDIAALALISAAWIALGGFTMLQTITIDSRVLLLVAGIVVVVLVACLAAIRLPAVQSRLTPGARNVFTLPLRGPRFALVAAVLTGLFWAMQMGVMAGLLRVFGVNPTPSLVFGVMGLPVLIGMLSPVPGGAGIREALMVGAAQLEQVSAGPVVLAAVAYRLALFVVTPAIWAVIKLTRRVLS